MGPLAHHSRRLTGLAGRAPAESARSLFAANLPTSGSALADGGAILLTTIDAARALMVVPAGSADLVEVRVDPAVGAAAVETRLDSRLTTQPYVLSTAADEAAAYTGAARDVGSALLLVAVVVLFVGALLVSDTLAMSVAERTREVGLLRSAGATRGQMHRMVLAEALWLGTAGTAVGVGLGAVFAVALAPAWRPSQTPVAGTGLDLAALAVSLLLGLLVTLAAALEPAWQAGRVPPSKRSGEGGRSLLHHGECAERRQPERWRWWSEWAC